LRASVRLRSGAVYLGLDARAGAALEGAALDCVALLPEARGFEALGAEALGTEALGFETLGLDTLGLETSRETFGLLRLLLAFLSRSPASTACIGSKIAVVAKRIMVFFNICTSAYGAFEHIPAKLNET